ncbi:hypothetical protein NX059_008069 [Plenodomus lindquistii]|nr:hypothetical protein NX059_008069 [Plenodomus lindquistii]
MDTDMDEAGRERLESPLFEPDGLVPPVVENPVPVVVVENTVPVGVAENTIPAAVVENTVPVTGVEDTVQVAVAENTIPAAVVENAVPIAVMTVPIDSPAQDVEQPQDEGHSFFLNLLAKIERDAAERMEGWEPMYRTQAPVENAANTAAGTKRKASVMDSDSEHSDSDPDTDSDDEEERIAPHDPDQQVRPKLPIYHPGFQLTEDVTKEVLSVFINYINTAVNSGYEDEEATHLRNDIVKTKKFKYQDVVRLAVAGDTGVGKSALLNAILGTVNLNPESDEGGACTCVITEFKQSPLSQLTPYAAEVEFFDLTVCIKLVTDLFRQWFAVKQKQAQNADDVDDNDLSQMKTAQECLQQMFADRLGQDDIEGFMGTATSALDNKVLPQLLGWTADVRNMFVGEGETSVCFGSNTPENLIEQYHPFTRDVLHASFRGRPLGFTPWPLVRMVRVTLNSPILKQNVVVADVPGSSDVNYFRVQNAQRYLKTCDMTIVVAKIDRVQDNTTFQHQYVEAFRRKRSGSVILVATRSDDLNAEGSSASNLDVTSQEQLLDIDQKLKELVKAITAIADELQRTRKDKKSKEVNKRKKKEKKKLMSKKNTLEKQRRDILIESRNKQVSRVLGGNYRANTGDDAGAAVYCVSNRMYMRHLRGYDTSDQLNAATMTLEQTQIPALCSHIYSLPSRGKTACLDHFIRVSTPTLLSIIKMSCSTTTIARANHLVDIVHKTRDVLAARVKELAKQFITTAIKLLQNNLADPALQTRFDISAKKSLTKWEQLNAASHRACINKKGRYIQKKKGIKLNWDEDLMAPVKGAIDMAFRTIIDDSVETFRADAAQATKEVLRELDETLKNDPKALACDAYKSCFKDSLTLYHDSVDLYVDKATKRLKDQLILVHLRATLVREDDYFPDAMSDIYEEAWGKKGAGKGVTMFDARKEFLKGAIPGPTGPFAELSGWAREDAVEALEEASQQLAKDLDGMLLQVEKAFDRMKRKKENDTPEGIKFRKGLSILGDEAERILRGVARESLDLCKQFK